MALEGLVPGSPVFNLFLVYCASSERQPNSRFEKDAGQTDSCRCHFLGKENLLRFVFKLVLEKIKILAHLSLKHTLDLNSVLLSLPLGKLLDVFLDLFK